MYAIDALFGLPRKKSAGVSHRPPLHGHLFFCDQEVVDQYVAEEINMKQSFQVTILFPLNSISMFLYLGLQ